jgi:hypothetical protein
MADKPGFLMEQQGQVIVTTEEGAGEDDEEEMVEEMCGGEEESEIVLVKSNTALKDYSSNHYEKAGGLVKEQEDEISLVRHYSLLRGGFQKKNLIFGLLAQTHLTPPPSDFGPP